MYRDQVLSRHLRTVDIGGGTMRSVGDLVVISRFIEEIDQTISSDDEMVDAIQQVFIQYPPDVTRTVVGLCTEEYHLLARKIYYPLDISTFFQYLAIVPSAELCAYRFAKRYMAYTTLTDQIVLTLNKASMKQHFVHLHPWDIEKLCRIRHYSLDQIDEVYNDFITLLEDQCLCERHPKILLPTFARYLVRMNRERYLLQHSSMFGVESVVQMLLQQGGSPTSDDIEEASEAGHVNVVRLLLEHGVERLTPRALELATLMNHVEVVRLLLEYGARPMHSDLFNASYNGHWMILQLLLPHGGSLVDSDDIEDASENGHVNVVRLLLEHGVRLTPRALKLAIYRHHVEVVQLLLEYGARPTEADLATASYNNHWTVVKMLLQTAPE